MKTIRVNITQDMIEQGHRTSPYCCPVAIGVGTVVNCDRGLKSPNHFAVTMIRIRFSDHLGREYFADPPPEVSDFIRKFDAGDPVSPFSFPLSIPDWVPLRETEV